MAIPKPITRVEQYLAHISGMRVNVPEAPLTREERYLAAWAKKSGIEDAEIQGDPPLTLKDCIGEPFKGLVLYGKSTQVTTTGAQLLDLTDLIGKTETKNGATYKINEDQSISVSGTPTEYTSFYLKAMSLKAGSYYFLSNSGDYKVFVQLIGAKVNMNNGFTLDEDAGGIGVYVVFNNTESFNMTFTSMLNAGDSALPWEPYAGGKPSPSPDYPQKIVTGIGDVTVRGKNIFLGPEQPKTAERGGLTLSYQNGVYTLIGTSTKDGWFNIYPTLKGSTGIQDVGKIIQSVGKVAIVNGLNSKKGNIAFRSANETNKTTILTSADSKKKLKFDINGAFIYAPAGTYSDTFTIMITDENQTEDYEPYRTPQTLTLSTPNGLPGIPVLSNGNYTDSTGQQWICDEVDLERGMYVQRVYSVIVDGADVVFSQEGPYCNMNLREMPSAKIVYASSPRAVAKSTFTSEPWNFNQEYGFLYLVKENYAEILNESCRRHNGEVIYAIATPIETPLSETDLAAYRALTTYRGTTILESECGLKVIYSKLRK